MNMLPSPIRITVSSWCGLCRAVFTGETQQLMPNTLELFQALDEPSRAGLKIQAECTSKTATCLAYHACDQ